jgi:predicted acetyltransferase
MPHLIEPQADQHLRVSFLEAMREFEVTRGHADAGGLTIKDLEGTSCLTHYTAGLRNGTSRRPGTAPLRCCEWWWVEGGPDGPTYIGRVALRHHAAPNESHLRVSVRPSRRREGHGTAILQAVLPIAKGHGVDPIRLVAADDDIAGRKMIKACGAALEHQQAG